MNDIEDRVRRALRAHLPGVDAEQMLGDVRHGVRRRRRRTAALAAASVLVAGSAGIAIGLGADGDQTPDRPPASRSPEPSPTLPADAARGVIDVAAASPDLVFRLTTNVGCVACSTVWRQDSSADGGWVRLHDFGTDAYRDQVNPTFGPVANFAMAANGRDGWAWGERLFSTHDGGETWGQIAFGPGLSTEYGHAVHLTPAYAWSLFRDERGTRLFRTPIGVDDWSTVEAPDLSGTSGMFTVGDSVALETSDEGLAGPRLRISTDGSTWSRLDLPCAGEPTVRPAESEVFALCTSASDWKDLTVYRTRDLSHWELVGRWTGVLDSFLPLADDRILLVGSGGKTGLMTPSRTRSVDLGEARGTGIYESSSIGELCYLVAYDGNSTGRLLRSTDGGLTWQQLE